VVAEPLSISRGLQLLVLDGHSHRRSVAESEAWQAPRGRIKGTKPVKRSAVRLADSSLVTMVLSGAGVGSHLGGALVRHEPIKK